jgi:hypothetical protein
VTTVREPAPTPASHTATPVAVPPSCRVSILAGESHQIDHVLPSAAPLNILVDPTVIAINKVLRGRGAAELPPAPYEFARAAGMSALASDVSLAGHNIVDGDVIALIPAGTAERYGPVVENVSTALAQYASEHFVRVSAQTALAVAAVIIGGALGVASLLLWRLRWARSALLVPICSPPYGLPGRYRGDRRGLAQAVSSGRRGVGGALHRGTARRAFRPATPLAHRMPFSPRSQVLGRGCGAVHRATPVGGRGDRPAGFGAAAVALVRMYWDVPGPRIAVAVLVAAGGRLRGAAVAPRMANVPADVRLHPAATSSRAPAANPKTGSRPWRMVRPPTSP